MWWLWQKIYNLKDHQNTAHLKVFENCSICQKPIGATHIKNHEKSYRKIFTNTIEKHYVSNGDSAEIPWQYSCIQCDKHYDNKECLQNHIRIVHEHKEKIGCENDGGQEVLILEKIPPLHFLIK